ncbi:MAG TPA: class I SAM-dependent methyltransferase [Thermoanaerobaculia bacterium]|nr:class I SAM-dependent methyltransferase [Thermoanaerobaculia bacterium]
MRIGIPAALKWVHRTAESESALWQVTEPAWGPTWGISVGGGPSRAHPGLYNLNIEPGPDVEILGDACALPFRSGSVPLVHCEAVLEHLEHPDAAVREMHRVLRPGGEVFAATPFLQAFHGFPGHFQNFTLEGHRRLFLRGGFEVLDSGVSVGPVAAITELIAVAVRELLPTRILSRSAEAFVRLVLFPLRALDRVAAGHPRAHMTASTTFVRARKRPGPATEPLAEPSPPAARLLQSGGCPPSPPSRSSSTSS